MKYLKGILLPALLALAPLATAKDEPIVETTPFNSELVNIFYFDDSEVAVLAELQTGKVWRSKNAGKSWSVQKELRTLGIIKSPFDNQVAVALGETTHWITYNQGEDWDAFDTPLPASLIGQPLSFHAKDNKKILYHTFEDCFSAPCLGQVSPESSAALLFMANSNDRHCTPTMASSRPQRSSAVTGSCACGRRAPSDFS